jgi:hypothetical protein
MVNRYQEAHEAMHGETLTAEYERVLQLMDKALEEYKSKITAVQTEVNNQIDTARKGIKSATDISAEAYGTLYAQFVKFNKELNTTLLRLYSWGKDSEQGKNFRDILDLAEKFAEMSEKEFRLLDPQDFVDASEAMTKMHARMKDLKGQGIHVAGLSEFIVQIEKQANVIAVQKTILKGFEEQLTNAEEKIKNIPEVLGNITEALGRVGAKGEDVANLLEVAFKAAGEEIPKELIKIIRKTGKLNTKLDETTEKLKRLRETAKELHDGKKWSGGYIQSANTKWYGDYVSRFADGGSVGSDNIPAMLRAGEFVVNRDAARQILPELMAANFGSTRFNSGGEAVTNNNIGDINITVDGGNTSETTVRRIGESLRREIKRGTVRLN